MIPISFFHVAPARIADHLGERGCHISTFGDCVIDPTRIMRTIQCPPADRWRMLLVLASGIDSQQCPNTPSIFAKRWSTERMLNSAMNLPFSNMTLQSNISTPLDVVFRRSDLKMDVYGRTTNNAAVPKQRMLSVPGVYVLRPLQLVTQLQL